MIGMMYLFYTALLALNISAEVLNAFVIVNEGMERTVENFGSKNALLYNDFRAQYEMNPTKVNDYWNAAQNVQTETNKLIEQIEDIKNQVVGWTEYSNRKARDVEYEYKDDHGDSHVGHKKFPKDVPLEWIKNKGNNTSPMNVLLGTAEDGTGGEATKLKKSFKDYKATITKLLGKDTIGLKLGLHTPDNVYNHHAGIKQNWEMNTFDHTVLAADLVLLNKYITEVRNIEFEIIKRLYSQISAKDFKFDKINAKVIPHANIVLSGEEYQADIFVAAYSTSDTPTVILKPGLDSVGNANLLAMEGTTVLNTANQGVVQYTTKTGSTGDFTYAGVIKVKQPDGTFKTYDFNSAYSVIKPSATVSADKMNVVYRGLDNPMSASAPGFTIDAVRLSSSGGGHLTSKGGGHYFFKPTKGGKNKKVTFSVSATKDGKTTSLGRFEYRIKNLPSPVIRIAGKSEGKIAKSKLLLSPRLLAQLDDFLFEGVRYRVVSYEIYVIHPTRGKLASGNIKGPAFPGKIISKIRKAPKRTLIIVRNVWVEG
ncbi:hypothetical protein DRO03_10690, partial [Methanosarcinales archaeon]